MNLKAIKGEKDTGFEKAGKLGEFECGNCRYFDGDSCGQADMMKHSKQPRVDGSRRVVVHEEDCCEFVDRVGRKDEAED